MDILSLSNVSMSSLKQTPLTCNGHTRPIVHLHFSEQTKSGYYLVSASKDGKPQIRQGDTGDWLGTFEGHKGAVWGVVLNSDGTRAATGSADFTAKIWNAVTGDELHSLPHKHIVKSVDFSTDDRLLLTASNEKIIRIYDLNNVNSEPQMMTGHTDNIRHVVFSSVDSGQQCVSACDDKTVRFWDRRSQGEVFKLTFDEVPTSIEVTRDKSILSICYGSQVQFFSLQSMTALAEWRLPTPVYSCSLHPQKNVFVCGGDDFLLYKYDYQTGEQLESFKGHFGAVHCVRFSPDGELYASGSEDGTLRLWQNTVGKTYGLWKYVSNGNGGGNGGGGDEGGEGGGPVANDSNNKV